MLLYGGFSIEWAIGRFHDYLENGLGSLEEIENYLHILSEEDRKLAIEGILAITRSKDESYFEYIARVKKNTYARRVKLVDLMVNLHLREEEPKESLKERYSKALKMLVE